MHVTFAIKGNVCQSVDKQTISIFPNAYLVCRDGICQGMFSDLPDRFKGIPVRDYGDDIIIPGIVDLHVHAAHYAFRGIGRDQPAPDWLCQIAYAEESKYIAPDYAIESYSIFVDALRRSATTRAVIFSTVHCPGTTVLMDMLEYSGLITYVGKSNMDQNVPDTICEKSPNSSIADTLLWIEHSRSSYKRTYPILAPYSISSCSMEMLSGICDLKSGYNLPVMTHLSGTSSGNKIIKNLYPNIAFPAQVLESHGLLDEDGKVIAAGLVFPSLSEVDLLQRRRVIAVHTPLSDMQLGRGMAPVRACLTRELKMGLGSDNSGDICMMHTMSAALGTSRLRSGIFNDNMPPLKLAEVFYMATMGGGEFFGKVGCFERGYEFDAVILSDENIFTSRYLTVENRLERMIHFPDEADIKGKYVRGVKIL